jgi:hypothetical protein
MSYQRSAGAGHEAEACADAQRDARARQEPAVARPVAGQALSPGDRERDRAAHCEQTAGHVPHEAEAHVVAQPPPGLTSRPTIDQPAALHRDRRAEEHLVGERELEVEVQPQTPRAGGAAASIPGAHRCERVSAELEVPGSLRRGLLRRRRELDRERQRRRRRGRWRRGGRRRGRRRRRRRRGGRGRGRHVVHEQRAPIEWQRPPLAPAHDHPRRDAAIITRDDHGVRSEPEHDRSVRLRFDGDSVDGHAGSGGDVGEDGHERLDPQEQPLDVGALRFGERSLGRGRRQRSSQGTIGLAVIPELEGAHPDAAQRARSRQRAVGGAEVRAGLGERAALVRCQRSVDLAVVGGLVLRARSGALATSTRARHMPSAFRHTRPEPTRRIGADCSPADATRLALSASLTLWACGVPCSLRRARRSVCS